MEFSPPPIPSSPQPAAHQPAPARRSPWGWVIALVIGTICLVVLAFVGIIFMGVFTAMKDSGSLAGTSSMHTRSTTLVSGGSQKIAHIDLEGIISASSSRGADSMVDEFSHKLSAAIDDQSVKAIVIRINSPGGEVTASDRLHQMIQTADRRKPVIAYMDTIAASGGYYAACGTRHLMAHPTTFTGSIGVIMQSMKYADMLDKVGLAMETYKSGQMKDLLSGSRATNPEEAALVQNLIAETYERFLEIVAENRGRPVSELRESPFTDGRIFSGKQGLDAGFVDSNGFISDAYDKAAALAGISNPTIITYKTRATFLDLLDPMATSKASSNKLEIDFSERLLPNLQTGVPLYLHLH